MAEIESTLANEVGDLCIQSIYIISNTNVTYDDIKHETATDPVLGKLKKELEDRENLDERYSINDGLIFRGSSVHSYITAVK